MATDELLDYLTTSPFAESYGTRILSLNDGIDCETPWQDDFTGNPLLRTWHGGVVSGVLELTGLLLVMHSNGYKPCELLSINTSYLRPTLGEHTLFTRADIVRSGKLIHTINTVAWQKSPEAPTATAALSFVSKEN